MADPLDFQAVQVGRVRCDGCGAEWQDLDAATHQDGYSEIGCPNRCGRLTTPVYWPNGEGWARLASDEDHRTPGHCQQHPSWRVDCPECHRVDQRAFDEDQP